MGYLLTPWRTRKPSWTVMVVVAVMLALPVMCVSARGSSGIERCLRMQLSPSARPPPPPAASRSRLNWSYVVCRDQFRMINYYLRSSGKLPFSYVEALCNIFGDKEQEVERYIKITLSTYDFNRLMDGRSCSTIQLQEKPPTPSPSSSNHSFRI